MAEIPLYDYAKMHTVKAVDILDIGTVYQTAITMTTSVLEEGLHMIGFSAQCDIDFIDVMVYRVGNVS